MSCFLGSDLESLLRSDEFIPLVAIVFGCTTGMVAILCATLAGVAKARTREVTKREIAAYVAEGSIDPDKAIAMLNAGTDSCEIKGDSIKIS